MSGIPNDPARRYPYRPSWKYDEPLDLLYESEKDDRPHIPTFARNLLEWLGAVGLLREAAGASSSHGDLRLAKMDRGQLLWVLSDAYRDPAGYLAVDVLHAPRSNAAILAAMTASSAEPVNVEQVREGLSSLEPPIKGTLDAYIREDWERLKAGSDYAADPAVDFVGDLDEASFATLEYVLALLRYHRPGFDDLPIQEQVGLIETACSHINDFLQSLRRLEAFLGYGASNRNLRLPIREPQRDTEAAILRDVEGLNYREIGERLNIPLPPKFEIKGEHQTVRKMVERGRGILVAAYGEEGWPRKAEAMKAEKARWWALSEAERSRELDLEGAADEFDVPLLEARRWIDSGLSVGEVYRALEEDQWPD